MATDIRLLPPEKRSILLFHGPKGKMEKGFTNLPYEIDGTSFIVIKNVPAMVCRQCGDSFIDIKVARIVEQIISLAQKDGITIGIVDYKKAA